MKIARFWERSRSQNGPRSTIEVVVGVGRPTIGSSTRPLTNDTGSRKRIIDGEPFPTLTVFTATVGARRILREIRNDEGETLLDTRNRYGAVVLNTADLMFIDIDVAPDQPLGIFDAIKGLFGNKPEDPFVAAHKRIAAVAASRPEYTIRMYRTFAGFRCSVINKRIKPGTADSDALLSAFGSDPLYIRLCKNQESFRARLTPKFWRCDYTAPRGIFPFSTESEKQVYRNWERGYEQASNPYSTCVFVDQFGSDRAIADFRGLIELHDRDTRAESNLPLA